MSKSGFFLRHSRIDESTEATEVRLQHFKEFSHRLPLLEVADQGARCMGCGVPFCHTGCPLGNDIPRFNALVSSGKTREALAVLHGTNNFPEFTGRICPAPCEAACVLNINDDAVTIETIEKEIAEQGWDANWILPHRPERETGKRVAIVGSGPAGLACAQQLRRQGHAVVVFEKREHVGGLLRFGIPDFKLEKRIVERRVAQLEAEGVVFRTNTAIGKDIALRALQHEFDAVVLATGASVPRDLPIPGRELPGIEFAMPFLEAQNRATPAEQPSPLSVAGKRVVVLGGGDTGSDCLGTSLRQGATSVAQLELMPQPPEVSSTPWPLWPVVLRQSTSQEEGGTRLFGRKTLRFFAGADGRVAGLETIGVTVQNGVLVEVPASEERISADVVLLALGFVAADPQTWAGSDLEQSERGQIAAPLASKRDASLSRAFATNLDKVFACGDARRGQSLVVWAIWEGREAARSVDAFLRKAESQLPASPLVAVPG